MTPDQAQAAADHWVHEHAPQRVARLNVIDGTYVASLRTDDDQPMFGGPRLVIDADGTVSVYASNVPPHLTVAMHRSERERR